VNCAGTSCSASADTDTCCQVPPLAKCSTLTVCAGNDMVKDPTKDNVDCAGTTCSAVADTGRCCSKAAKCSTMSTCPSSKVKDTSKNNVYCAGCYRRGSVECTTCTAMDVNTCCVEPPVGTVSAKLTISTDISTIPTGSTARSDFGEHLPLRLALSAPFVIRPCLDLNLVMRRNQLRQGHVHSPRYRQISTDDRRHYCRLYLGGLQGRPWLSEIC
jgi:hypothetical protein